MGATEGAAASAGAASRYWRYPVTAAFAGRSERRTVPRTTHAPQGLCLSTAPLVACPRIVCGVLRVP
jgi:hypothetical protein